MEKLFKAVGTWDSEPIDFDVFEMPGEEMFIVAEAVRTGKHEACPCFIEAFMFFRALRYSAEWRHCEQIAERQ